MKAIISPKYGSPDVLSLVEIEKPFPKDDEVLLRIHAAALNAYDWHMLRADPFFIRFGGNGFLRPRNTILGADVAGKIEAVGKNVKEFKVGDDVHGCLGKGGFAEYVCAREKLLTLKPTGMTFEKAASMPMAAVTALQGLRDLGQIQPGQKVLINGASSGVGTFAVQIAKSFGAEVTGVCSKVNLDMVRSIGADHVIDYTQEDFARNGQQYDLILDIAASHSVSDYKRALSPKGICVVVGFSSVLHMLRVSFLGSRALKSEGKRIVMLMTKYNKKDLVTINKLLEAGKVVPVIDRYYPLSEVADAIRYLEKKHARGKVIIQVTH